MVEIEDEERIKEMTRPFLETREYLTTNPSHVSVLLYLLHSPSYPYEIAKNFEEARESGFWHGPKTLCYPNHVSKIMKSLRSKNLVLPYKIKRMRGRPKKSESFLASGERASSRPPKKNKRMKVNPEMLSRFHSSRGGSTLPQVYSARALALIPELSKQSLDCIKTIDSIKTKDYEAFFLYVSHILNEFLAFHDLAQPPSEKTIFASKESRNLALELKIKSSFLDLTHFTVAREALFLSYPHPKNDSRLAVRGDPIGDIRGITKDCEDVANTFLHADRLPNKKGDWNG